MATRQRPAPGLFSEIADISIAYWRTKLNHIVVIWSIASCGECQSRDEVESWMGGRC